MRNSLSNSLSLSDSGGYLDEVALFAMAIDGNTGTKVTDTDKEILRHMVKDLKGTGIWKKIICLYPFVGDADAHAYNLINPGKYKLSFGGSPTHDANGVHFANGQYGMSDYNVPYNTVESFQFTFERTPLAAHNKTGFTFSFSPISEAGYSLAHISTGTTYWARCGGAIAGVSAFARTANPIGHTLINRTDANGFNVLWENQKQTTAQVVYNNGTPAVNNLVFAFQSAYGTLPTDLSFACFGHGKGNSLTNTEEQSLITIVRTLQSELNRI